MNISIAGPAARVRQLPPLARPAVKVVNWQPAARFMIAGLAFVTLGSQGGVPLRLSIAGAGVAATSAFLLDDPAAVTLASSPTSLPIRRLHRIIVAALAVSLWWAAAVAVAANRTGRHPVAGEALEVSVLVAIALAASALASTIGDRATGGIAGAACSMACYATTLLPPQPWLPLPPDPDAPDATTRLLATLILATMVLVYSSRDPAKRTLRNPIARTMALARSDVQPSNPNRRRNRHR